MHHSKVIYFTLVLKKKQKKEPDNTVTEHFIKYCLRRTNRIKM